MTRQVTTTPLKQKAARSMRTLADKVEREHPGMMTHKHIRDAAHQVEIGNTEGARRHLAAAEHDMTPQTLMRHGNLTDEHHAAAKQNMGLVHREVLRTRDIDDAHDRNQASIARMRDNAAGTAIPGAPAPSTDMNAPGRPPTGGPDRSVAGGPKPPSPTTSQNHSNVELAFDPAQPRDGTGKWTRGLGVSDARKASFRFRGGAGSFSHARAIRDLGDYLAPGGELKTGFSSADQDTARNALHNAARMMVARNIPASRTHMQVALQAARRIGPGQEAMVQDAIDSLDRVPAGYSGRSEPRYGNAGNTAPMSLQPRLAGSIQMSAETGALATTPHPFGKPGGPGLWHVKGMELPPYIQNIARALLRTGRAKTLSEAIAIAKGATARWVHGKNTSPEVRAASAATNADWAAKQARAHAHSLTTSDVREIFELAWHMSVVIELTGTAAGAAKDPRAPTGKFGSGGQTKTAAVKQGGKSRAQQKAALLKKAAADRKEAHKLLREIVQLQHASKAATSAAKSATKAGTTGKTASSTPAKTSTTASSTSGASTAAAKKPSSTASRIASLRAQARQLFAAAAAATAQAAKL